MEHMPLAHLLQQVRQCRQCESDLPLGANPVLQAGTGARLLIIGQAPGTRVHHSSMPWNDPSGERLRDWLLMDKSRFYDPEQVAIIPMGFCYPGKGSSGDLPPRSECAPLWHQRLLALLPNIELTLLIGQYAQQYYLSGVPGSVTETVRSWQRWAPGYFPLPHPSPRNTLWLRRNPWFAEEVLPALRERIGSMW
jgi:uracil-DNA glycosylase